MNSKHRKQTKTKRQTSKKVEEIVLHNYQSEYKPITGVSGGWHNTDITLPSYVPRGCIEKYILWGKPELYLPYLEMPDQVMEFGDEVQKGLVKCIWKTMQENPESSTFKDVTHKEHPLYKCIGCNGNDRQAFECVGYKYRLQELRAYNQGLKGNKK